MLFLCIVADRLTFRLPWQRTCLTFFCIAFVDQIWIILNLCELLICTFAESRYIAFKMTFPVKFTDGLMNLLPW